jgi:predicted Fe-Mo cluster-binding NifX family protein
MATVVALPSTFPGGLDAEPSDHFGQCDLYTLVTVDGERVGDVRTLPNPPHGQGGCLAPVNLLATNGVNILIAEGMGMRPLSGFDQAGIMVLHGGGKRTVREAVSALVTGQLQRFAQNNVCGGSHGGGCH